MQTLQEPTAGRIEADVRADAPEPPLFQLHPGGPCFRTRIAPRSGCYTRGDLDPIDGRGLCPYPFPGTHRQATMRTASRQCRGCLYGTAVVIWVGAGATSRLTPRKVTPSTTSVRSRW